MFLKSSNFFTDKKGNNSLSIMGEGIDFVGEINTEGNIHVDGNMKGVIKAHEVVIGPKGDFDGEISAEILIINGSIKGKFSIRNLHVRKGGLLQGRAKYEIIVVDSGGRVQGELGINKQTKQITKKNGKDKLVSTKNGNSNNT
tara:strand:- start:107 stop:535 length:429 start_codon:yes stop_codon:yes gene_type:complete